MIQLSLGCGRNKEENFIGLDYIDYSWNKIWSAGNTMPFDNDSVDFIKGYNFFEHLRSEEIITTLNECHRVLKLKGILEFIVPDAINNLALAISDITHKSLWSIGTFKYLTGEKPQNADYGIRSWKIIKLENYQKEPRCIFAQLTPNK